MIKILLVAVALIILAFIIASIYCICVFASYFNENEYDESDDILLKKQICSECKTGQYYYELDPDSCICPNINSLKNGRCEYFDPIGKKAEQSSKGRIKAILKK